MKYVKSGCLQFFVYFLWAGLTSCSSQVADAPRKVLHNARARSQITMAGERQIFCCVEYRLSISELLKGPTGFKVTSIVIRIDLNWKSERLSQLDAIRAETELMLCIGTRWYKIDKLWRNAWDADSRNVPHVEKKTFTWWACTKLCRLGITVEI